MTEQTSRLAVIIDSTGAQKNADSLASALGRMTQAGDKAVNSAGKVTKATEEEKEALSDLLDRIDPVNAALNKLDKQQESLAKFKAKGMVDTDTFELYSKRIEDTRNKLTGFRDDLGKTGMSAKQTAWAMRMIPAQMTDIVVGLSTGQSPFMVLMQQGGQLKDMFGGIGPAIKGVGGYVAGLINPFTLAAAAVGVLGLAYYKGSQEQDEFYKSLTLTGNLVGKTSGQLADMAARVSVAANSTTGAAASTLNQLVSSGKVAGDALERVTTAIVKTSEATGIATDKLVGDFNEIAADPVAAITKLNDQYHFLTLATYNQIKALQDEGNQQEAARVASEAYSSSLIQRSNDIKENLGLLEKAWDGVWGSAKKAWDAMFDVGREASIDQKIKSIEEAIDRAQAIDSQKIVTGFAPLDSFNAGKAKQESTAVKVLRAQLKELNSQKIAQETINELHDGFLKKQQDGIKLQQDQDAFASKYQTRQQQMAKELKELNDLKARGAKLDYASLEAEIRNRYKEPDTPKTPSAPKGKAYTEDAATRLLDQLNRQHEVMQQQLNTTEKIGTAEQALVKWKSQLSEIQKKGILTAEQKSLLANQASITAQYEKNAALEKEIALRKDADKLTAYKNTLSSGLQNDAIGLQNSLNSNTVLSQEQKRQQELTKIASDYQKKQVELTNQRTTGQISQSLYDEETAALQQALNQRLAMQQAYYSQLDQLNGNWQLGVQNGLQSYLNSIPTLYESVTSATTSILSSTESAISSNLSAMVQGTESLSEGFKNMATGMGQAVIDALTKMAAQWLVYQAVQLLVGKSTAVTAGSTMALNAQAMAKTAELNAYASTAAIPIYGPALAPAAAGAAAMFAEPLAASIGALSLTGMAHNGIDSVPSTGTWLLEKGERVMTAQTSARLDSTLENLRKNGMDATLSKPGYGTGVQNVSSNQNSTTVHAPIEQNVYVQGGDPEQLTATLRKNNDELSKRLTKQIEQKMTGEVLNPQGNFGKALKSRYVRGYKE
ncbi:phage tail length tape measure family protein [Klebsiella oxytoca]|uniref:phage tail length tape measure family protein n=1 Tax=Klebsiella oxytoca TaxID=571 RepID=UPI00265E236E|nr:phage tail length tape measure family protein [Klebsiella oxytoca]WKM72887.1 phage tail length tape measure family protein [Klebsiella oxytoca]